MNVERWQTLKSLFLEAASLSSDEQQAFLRDLKLGDTEMSDLLRELLGPEPGNRIDLERPFWSPGDAVGNSEQSLATGQRLVDRFEVVGFLGAGGAGEVYRAYDHHQSVFIAVKTLHPEFCSNAAAVARLRKELNTARSVTHGNVCRLYDFHWRADADTPPFFTMALPLTCAKA